MADKTNHDSELKPDRQFLSESNEALGNMAA